MPVYMSLHGRLLSDGQPDWSLGWSDAANSVVKSVASLYVAVLQFRAHCAD